MFCTVTEDHRIWNLENRKNTDVACYKTENWGLYVIARINDNDNDNDNDYDIDNNNTTSTNNSNHHHHDDNGDNSSWFLYTSFPIKDQSPFPFPWNLSSNSVTNMQKVHNKVNYLVEEGDRGLYLDFS